MTDELREDLKPEEEDVEGHAAPLAPLSPGEKLANDDDDDDVEGHAAPLAPLSPGEKLANDDDDVEGHAPPPLAPL
jgi:hypothetical protein